MRIFNVTNLPEHKANMANTPLSELTFAMSPDYKVWQIIPVGQDEVAMISVILQPEMSMAGVKSVRELMAEFKDGYFALSFDKDDFEDFMATPAYVSKMQ